MQDWYDDPNIEQLLSGKGTFYQIISFEEVETQSAMGSLNFKRETWFVVIVRKLTNSFASSLIHDANFLSYQIWGK